jgi:hypothetical protein
MTDSSRQDSGHFTQSRRGLNLEFNARLRKRLRDHKRAMQYLTNRGLTLETIEHFCLGLSLPYDGKKSGRHHSDALMYPLRRADGNFSHKYGYYNIPGVTQSPLHNHSWSSGEPCAYYSSSAAGKRLVLVCQRPIDLWRHGQALTASVLGADLLLICSTHESAIPDEWKEQNYWTHWETIFIGYDNDEAGETLTDSLAQLIGRDARRALVPAGYGKDWTDFWQGGAEVSEFTRLLRDAPICSLKVRSEPDGGRSYGRFAYKPVNINGAFHNGHLYHTVQLLNRIGDVISGESGRNVVREVERLETVVVRSDRTVHSAVMAPAPKGTKDRDRVMRLTDGTLIDREPQPNKYGTWSWTSIKAYLDGKSKTRPMGEILREVRSYLKSSVWLPQEEDYAILTLLVPVTFAQAIFDSVPLIFLNGPAGSGKSEMGRAMARICCNAYLCGQSSAASIARFIDESRGFVVLDDLEMIGGRGAQFSELVQALKLSYNKATAIKLWTDVKTMRTQLLDFYGVKMINNTRGTGEILGSRMLRIRTCRIPEEMKREFGHLLPAVSTKLNELRDELHSWTFEHVKEIETAYRRLYPRTSDRVDEITAPLRVMASLAGDAELSSQLEVALTKQQQQLLKTDDPRQILEEALKNLIAQGYQRVGPTHVTLEMRKLIGESGSLPADEMPRWLKPGWIGRMLRHLEVMEEEPDGPARIRLYGMNLRFFTIRAKYLAEVKEWFEKRGTNITTDTKQVTEFCGDCESCPYSAYGCEIMWKRRSLKKLSGSRL